MFLRMRFGSLLLRPLIELKAFYKKYPERKFQSGYFIENINKMRLITDNVPASFIVSREININKILKSQYIFNRQIKGIC